jgi:hypothetical protein
MLHYDIIEMAADLHPAEREGLLHIRRLEVGEGADFSVDSRVFQEWLWVL